MILKPLATFYMALPMHIQRLLRYVVGGLLLLLGVIGLLLPILPGIPFLLLGGWLLGWQARLQPWLHRWYPLDRFTKRYSNGLPGGKL